jgi:pimeloyl-ACP methyl ester carboxylesterase
MARVLANGLDLHVQEMAPGTGHPGATVVCVHGILTDSLASYYFTLAKPLADAGARVLMYDQRGHGRSERPPSGYRLDDFVADLAALLDLIGPADPVYLLGNSFGGTVAFGYAARYPSRVAGVAVVESEPATAEWAAKMAVNLARAATDLRRPEAMAWIAARYGLHTARLGRAASRLLQATTVERDIPASEVLTPAEISAIGCPVLAIYGEKSDLAEQAPAMRASLPDCTTVVVPGQEHSVLIGVPGTVRDLVLRWLAERLAVQATQR